MADTQVKAEPAASVKEEQTPAVPASAGAGSGAGAGAGATAGSTSGTSAAAATPRPVPQIPLPPPIQKAEEAVAADKYDAEAWRLIFDHAQSKPIEYARTVYERFMEVFPTAGRYWKYYADHEERSGFPERTTEVLKRALVHTVNVDVWKFYVDFTARQKQAQLKASASPSEVEEARKEIQDAYKLALDNVGLALASFPLWDAYIKFLTEAPVRWCSGGMHGLRSESCGVCAGVGAFRQTGQAGVLAKGIRGGVHHPQPSHGGHVASVPQL